MHEVRKYNHNYILKAISQSRKVLNKMFGLGLIQKIAQQLFVIMTYIPIFLAYFSKVLSIVT